MPIPTSCPRCGTPYLLADRQAGLRVCCPECREPFTVPGADRTDVRRALPPVPQLNLPAVRVVKRPALLGTLLFGGFVFCVVFLAGIGGVALWLLLGTSPSYTQNKSTTVAPEAAGPVARNREEPKADGEPVQPPVIVRPNLRTIIPPPNPVAIHPPALEQDPVVVRLPAPVGDVAVGGGGRYLILLLPSVHQLAVFDVNEAKVVKHLPVADEAVKIAAGMDKLVVVQPGDKSVLRYSLTTFEREAAVPVRMEVHPVAATMGSASNGPLVISGVDYPRLGETVFFDVTRMQRIELPLNPHDIFETSPRVFLRAAADGRTFACQAHDGMPTQTCTWSKGEVVLYSGGRGSFPVPGPDGQVIYTDNGRLTAQLQPLARGGPYGWPAHHGSYYLSLPRDQKDRLDIHLAGVNQPLCSLADVGRAPHARDPLPLDKRIHLIPDARFLVVIPADNDRLILRRLDLEQALAKARFPFVAITSRPPTAAQKGARFRYQLQAKTDRGDAEYRIEAGPPGMAIDPKGLLTWLVPGDFADSEVDVTLHAKSPSGAETSKSFRIGVSE
jgi:hypothetical protein